MLHPQFPWPPERPEQFSDLLHEQGASPEECADLLSTLYRLREWQAPRPSSAETQRLLTRLTPELPTLSPIRLAIREYQRQRGAFLLRLACVQVSLFGLAFWLVSALITLLGAGIVLSKVVPDQGLVLRACGPLLAYLGTIVAFRGKEARVLELELACSPSPLQLTIARLVIVLGYDLVLSLVLSLVLWTGGSGQVLELTLSWLMPLLLVTGLALLLSSRLRVQAAASLAYGIWLVAVASDAVLHFQTTLFMPALEVLPGCVGLALLTLALVRIHTNMHWLLPHQVGEPFSGLTRSRADKTFTLSTDPIDKRSV